MLTAVFATLFVGAPGGIAQFGVRLERAKFDRTRHVVRAHRLAALRLLARVVVAHHLPGVLDQAVFEGAGDGIAVLLFSAVYAGVVRFCAKCVASTSPQRPSNSVVYRVNQVTAENEGVIESSSCEEPKVSQFITPSEACGLSKIAPRVATGVAQHVYMRFLIFR